MGSILIAMPKQNDANRIASLLRNSGLLFDINICDTGADVLRISNDRDFGVVICTKRMRDMSYTEMGEMLPRDFGTIVLTRDTSLEVARDDMIRLILPFQTRDLIDTIYMLTAEYMRRPKKKKEKPPGRSDDEKKIIDKAKSVLMDRNGMSEPEAFRFIQKNSMDYGRKLVESAEMILTLYSDKLFV